MRRLPKNRTPRTVMIRHRENRSKSNYKRDNLRSLRRSCVRNPLYRAVSMREIAKIGKKRGENPLDRRPRPG